MYALHWLWACSGPNKLQQFMENIWSSDWIATHDRYKYQGINGYNAQFLTRLHINLHL